MDTENSLAFSVSTDTSPIDQREEGSTAIESHIAPMEVMMMCRRAVYGVGVDIRSKNFLLSAPIKMLALIDYSDKSERNARCFGVHTLKEVFRLQHFLTSASLNRWSFLNSPDFRTQRQITIDN